MRPLHIITYVFSRREIEEKTEVQDPCAERKVPETKGAKEGPSLKFVKGSPSSNPRSLSLTFAF